MSYRAEEIPARIRYYWHPREEVKLRPVSYVTKEEVLQKIQEAGGTLEEIVVSRRYFVVRDIGGHVVPGGDGLTKKQATDLAAKLNDEEDREKAAQEQRLAEHKRQKDEQERRTREDIANRRQLACSTEKVRELSNEVTETERNLRALEADASALEEKLDLNRINITVCKAKLVVLKDALKSAKGESK